MRTFLMPKHEPRRLQSDGNKQTAMRSLLFRGWYIIPYFWPYDDMMLSKAGSLVDSFTLLDQYGAK